MLVLNVRGRGVQLTATFLPRIWLSFNVSGLSLCRFHRISDVGFGWGAAAQSPHAKGFGGISARLEPGARFGAYGLVCGALGITSVFPWAQSTFLVKVCMASA